VDADPRVVLCSVSSDQNLDPDEVVRNFIQSLSGNANVPQVSTSRQARPQQPFPHIGHLLVTDTTVPMVEEASEDFINSLLALLPPTVVVMGTDSSSLDVADDDDDEDNGSDNKATEPTPAAVAAAIAAMDLSEKRRLVVRVLRSPQFQQSLTSLNMALREGGLPDVAAALGVKLDNGGRLPGGMPLGGDAAIKAFVEGIKKAIMERRQQGRE